MDRLVRLYLNEEIPEKGFGSHYNPHFERYTQLGEKIPELQAEIDFLKINLVSSDEILHETQDLYSRWTEFTTEEKRKIIETITEKIQIGENEISIQLQYVPSDGKLMAEGSHNLMGSSRRLT